MRGLYDWLVNKYDWLVNREEQELLLKQIIITWYLACIGAIIVLLQAMLIRGGSDFLLSLGTDFIGGAVLYIFLTLIINRQLRREATKQEKERLILLMGSYHNAFALEAVRSLEARGWLKDGSLKGAPLHKANLQEAPLDRANLQKAFLREANLQDANLHMADLQGAFLFMADLQRAKLRKANLRGARLWEAKLQGAEMRGADLSGADLHGADLQGARLFRANLQGAILQGVTLPDGSKWTPDTDMSRFTNPNHPKS